MGSPGRLEALDGLRGLAVLIVFLSHTSGRDIKIAPWLDFVGIGHVGVYLFFVISGFLLTRNLLDGQPIKVFLLRRFFRIAPIYYLVLLGTFAYQLAVGTVSTKALYINDGVQGLMLSLLFLKGDGVFWSLAAEFAFYALLPVILMAIARFGWVWAVILASISFAWLVAISAFRLDLPPLRFVDIRHATQYFDVFLCGVAAAFIKQRLPHHLIALMFAATIVLTLVLVSRNFLGFDRPLYAFRWLSLPISIVFALAIASLAQSETWLTRVISVQPLPFMGTVGLSWYLLHFAMFPVVKSTGVESGPALFVMASLVVAAVSWLTYSQIERRFIKWGRLFESPPKAIASSQRANPPL